MTDLQKAKALNDYMTKAARLLKKEVTSLKREDMTSWWYALVDGTPVEQAVEEYKAYYQYRPHIIYPKEAVRITINNDLKVYMPPESYPTFNDEE